MIIINETVRPTVKRACYLFKQNNTSTSNVLSHIIGILFHHTNPLKQYCKVYIIEGILQSPLPSSPACPHCNAREKKRILVFCKNRYERVSTILHLSKNVQNRRFFYSIIHYQIILMCIYLQSFTLSGAVFDYP